MKRLSKIQFLLFALWLMVCIPVSSWAVDGQRKLTQPVPPATFPIVINQAGSYVLTSNLVVPAELADTNAIEITVNDVTLDLNGHKIQGPNTGAGNANGIYAADRYSITIKNGRIWGFGQCGVWLYSSSDPTEKGAGHIIENIQATNNAYGGIRVTAGLIINCTANNNGIVPHTSIGISVWNSTVTNCTANNNIGYGISSSTSTITQCTTNYNSLSGIISNSSIIKNCTVCNNSYHGIYSGEPSYSKSYIMENNLRDNGLYGLRFYVPNGNDFAIKNVASGNGSGNFYAESGNYMPLTGDNANYGF